MDLGEGAEQRRELFGPAGRVWLLSAVMAVASAAVVYVIRGQVAPVPHAGPIAWVVIALAFGAAEIWVVHLQFRREAHTISLSEIPLTAALFFLAPWQLIVAQLAGVVPALLVGRRQSSLKAVFNVAQMTLCSGIAALVFHALLGSADPLGPASWIVSLVATAAACLVGIAAVRAAISLTEGHLTLKKSLPVSLFSLAGGAINTSLALVGVVTIYRDVRAGALLLMPAGALFLAYQAYTRERQKTERIEFLYNSGRTLAGVSNGEAGIVQLLRESLDMFRADLAEVCLWNSDGLSLSRTVLRHGRLEELEVLVPTGPADGFLVDIMAADRGVILNGHGASERADAYLTHRSLRDAMVTALKADSRVIGTILVGDRLGDITAFSPEHLNLLETLATQVGVSVENERLERVLKHQAFHDSLTNLANRALLTQRIDAALARPGAAVAVLLIDIDEFKAINDTMGHTVGDQLLVAVAERLAAAVRTGDLAARIGGDEFAILAEEVNSEGDAAATAQRVIDAFRRPFNLGGEEVRVTASTGIATNLGGLLDPGTLLLQADVAMYAAKEAETGGYRIFESSMQDEVAERHALREDLRLALERGELINHYQPLLSLDGPEILGMEALVRWVHPERGMVAPGYFIRIAEESGLIVDLGRWVLREACMQLRAWQRQFPNAAPPGVSVNLSAVQLRHPGFVDDVVAILKEADLDARYLTLEITESTFMDDTRTAIARLRELRGLGIRLELDDFGTGFSSLSILRDLPLDGLKIDKSFVDVIGGASDRPVFLQAIVRLAEALELEMVGEGIEHQHQADALRAMGCNRGQGYLFSRPLPAVEMEAYIGRSAQWSETPDNPVVALPTRRRSD